MIIYTEKIEWHDAAADLPDDVSVLVTLEDGMVTEGYYDAGVWRSCADATAFEEQVHSWAEMPEGATRAWIAEPQIGTHSLNSIAALAVLPEHTTPLMDTIRGIGPTALYWIGGVVVVFVGWMIILGFCEAFGVVDRDEWRDRDEDGKGGQ